jgi:NAD(P)-dependent dehydrogenase (short-subunit alcohol dehydrogenase family)
VAVVTGGGKGIGRGIALELSARGARVVVTGRDERALGETVGEIAHGGGQARHVVGDVRDDDHVTSAVARAFEIWGRLDVAVANAGISASTPLGQRQGTSIARAVIETNLLGAYLLFDAALEVMHGPGRLIAISSVLGKFGASGQAAYCASKSGLHGLVRALALDLGARGVTCNAVCPGWVDTDMARARLSELAAENQVSYETMKQEAREEQPIGRFVEIEEVARLVAFLCSNEAGAITGQAISICGGATPFAG